MVALLAVTSPSVAQPKTVKACQEEWRAAKADFQAKGITEKAYVAQCRAGAATAPAETPTPAAAPSPAAPPTAAGEPKTAKACQEEWRAAKADFQAKGITERAYVAQCRAGTVAAPAPAAAPAPPPAAATGGPKTAKACQEEWRAAKADFQAKGITERAYVAQCRAGTVAAPAEPPAPAAAPAPPPAAAAPPPARPAAAAPAAPPSAPAPTAATTPTGAGQFAAEAQAKAHCPADLVVWANLKSKIYHFAGHRSYGTTKEGAYMCERDAVAQGMRASKTEKRPS